MRISAKADYAVRAALELAASDGKPVKGERLAEAQGIPLQFLEHILLELKHARLIQARRGAKGGYWLARDPSEITIADVIRAVEGPLANIHENAPEELHYGGPAERLRDVWVAVRAALRSVLESVTLAEISGGDLPWRIEADPQRPRGLAQALSLLLGCYREPFGTKSVHKGHKYVRNGYSLSPLHPQWIRGFTSSVWASTRRSSCSGSASACSSA